MAKDNFEKYIQSVFQGHKVPVDTDEIWAGVEPQLPPRYTAGFWRNVGIVGAFILTALSAIYLYEVQSESRSTQEGSIPVAEQLAHNTSTNNNDQKLSIVDTDLKERSNNPESGNKSSQYLNSDEDELQHDDEIEGMDREKEFSDNQTPVSKNRSSNFFYSTPSYDQEDETVTRSEADHLSTLSVEKTLSLSKSGERVSFDALSPLRFSDQQKLQSSFIALDDALPELNDCYDFGLRSWLWTVDTYIGFNYANKSLSNKQNDASGHEYIRIRNNSERYLDAFEGGVAVSAVHRSGMMISSGVNYSQIDEKFNFLQVRDTSRFDSIVVRIEIDSAGRADSIKSWREVTVRTAKDILTYNTYRMVDIPIALGYQFHKGKWTIEIQGGAMINLLFKKEGEILDPSKAVIDITENESVFKNGLGLTLFGSVKAIYPVTDRIGIYAEPTMRFQLSSITADNYPLNQRYNQFGLRAGARWIF